MKILVVEDDKPTYSVISLALSKRFEVIVAENGQKAIDSVSKELFALILLDINLGRPPNGIEVAKIIRKFKHYKNVPIIAVTAYAMEGDKEEILSQGFSDYISKPFSLIKLNDLVDKYLCT